MNLQAIQVFCEVVRLQSFSRGAAECGISQSAASQIIRHLEDELEFELIDRSKRPLQPTVEGEIYYRGCQDLLHGYRLVLDEIHRARKELVGLVRVVSIYSVGLHTLNPRIERFTDDNPGTTIRLEYLHPDQVYEAVLNDEADIGVTSYPKPTRGLAVVSWLEEDMRLVCNPGHPLARKKRVKPADLNGQKFVGFVGDLPIRREIDRALRQHQIEVEMVGEFDNIETIKQALEISDSVSILPQPSIEREVGRGTLAQVPVETLEISRPVGIIYKKRKKLAPTALLFLDSLTSSVDGQSGDGRRRGRRAS